MYPNKTTRFIRRSLPLAALAGATAWFAAQQPTESAFADGAPRAVALGSASAASPLSGAAAPKVTARSKSAFRPGHFATKTASTPSSDAQRAAEPPGEQEVQVTRARAELDDLRAQDPRAFLEIFEVMKAEGKDAAALGPLRHITERYISARGLLLERVLSRFIDDPNASLGPEFERLERLAAEYRRELDWYAQKVPDVANLDEILATTTLKLPSFVTPSEAQATSPHQIAAADMEPAIVPDIE